MYENLIIEENTVYELVEECIRNKPDKEKIDDEGKNENKKGAR